MEEEKKLMFKNEEYGRKKKRKGIYRIRRCKYQNIVNRVIGTCKMFQIDPNFAEKPNLICNDDLYIMDVF